MAQLQSPLLDDYNRTGIVTPALQRALDSVRQKLPQFQGLPGAPSDAQPSGPTLLPPSAPLPQITRNVTPAPVTATGAPPPAAPQRAQAPLITDPDAAQHVSERDRLIRTGPGDTQIHNPFLRGLARTADVAGSMFFPAFTAAIPGTELHHNYLVRRAENTVDKDAANAKENATTAETEQRAADEGPLRAAQTREANARANDLEHPAPKEPTNLLEWYRKAYPDKTPEDYAKFEQENKPTAEKGGTVHQLEDGSLIVAHPDGTATPVTVDGKPVKGKTTEPKETGAEEDQKYQALIAKRYAGTKLTPGEEADVKAYEHRKTLGQQVTNVYAGERAKNAEVNKQVGELHKTLMGEFSTARTQLDNVAQAREELTANPVGQNIGSIKTIVALAGGKGTGVRITQAELNSLADKLGLKTTFNNWLSSIEGKGRFDTATMQQINQVLDGVERIGREKEAKLNASLDSLQGANSKEDVDKIEREYRHSLSGGGGQSPTITSQAEFDKLPKGAEYMEDGKKYRKP